MQIICDAFVPKKWDSRGMEMKRIEIDIMNYPKALHKFFQSGCVFDCSGNSSAKTFFCDSGYYVKMDDRGELAREAALGRMFHKIGFGVEIIDYLSADKDYLVTKSAIGKDLTYYLEQPEQLCKLLAAVLRDLHSRPVENVPISSRHRRYLDSADGEFSGGYYDESVLMDTFWIRSKEEAWEIMQANKHRLRSDTLIHGDICLSNVMCINWKFSSLIDFNMSGRGDKHIDLYWAVWSLQHNLKTLQYTNYFLDLYGRNNFDPDTLKVVAAFEVFG